MAIDRKKVVELVTTLKDVSIDTSRFRFHFSIENELPSTNEKSGDDEMKKSFSKGYKCIFDLFKDTVKPIKRIRKKCCNNPIGFSNVEQCLFDVLDEITGLKIKVTSHFAHIGDVINEFELTRDMWVVDSMEVVDMAELQKKLNDKDFISDFEEDLKQITRDDDF